jgi:hypothetical protein
VPCVSSFRAPLSGTLNDLPLLLGSEVLANLVIIELLDKNYETGMWIGRNSNVVSSGVVGVMETVALSW